MEKISKNFSWGIIGTSDGYQYSVQGSDNHLDMVHYWDLGGEGAMAFPKPSEKAVTSPLYCLHSFSQNKQQVSALAQYCSVHQQGNQRMGTFAGSFIAASNATLNQPDNAVLFEILNQLTHFQFDKKIDRKSLSYTGDIANLEFPTPTKVENLTLNRANAFIMTQPRDEELFVSFETEEERNKILELAITSNSPNYYQKIYFSDNLEIISNFEQKTDIICLNFKQFKESTRETAYLFRGISHIYQKLVKERQEKEHTIRLLKSNKDSGKQQLKGGHTADEYIAQIRRLRRANSQLNDKLKKPSSGARAFGLLSVILIGGCVWLFMNNHKTVDSLQKLKVATQESERRINSAQTKLKEEKAERFKMNREYAELKKAICEKDPTDKICQE